MYQRILLKLSGEAFLGSESCHDMDVINRIANDIKEARKIAEILVVVGGGNIIRGASFAKNGIDRVSADHMGMLGTIINGIVLKESLISIGVPSVVMSAISVGNICETYSRTKALEYATKGYTVIFVGGTGDPFFTTDTASALRAAEMNCNALFKATHVDGIYDKDPKQNSDAKKFDKIEFADVIKHNLKVMDMPAISIAKENMIPIVIFNINETNMLYEVLLNLINCSVIS